MKAIVIEKFRRLASLIIKDVAQPEPEIGWMMIRVTAFGVNHAEMHMREGEWAEWMPISGIECVGIVTGSRAAQLTTLGVEKVEIEGEDLSEGLPEKFDAIPELVGNITILDSLKMDGSP